MLDGNGAVQVAQLKNFVPYFTALPCTPLHFTAKHTTHTNKMGHLRAQQIAPYALLVCCVYGREGRVGRIYGHHLILVPEKDYSTTLF